MADVKDRAVNVAFHDGRLLVMRRHKNGRDYCVLPGGGVEDGEGPRDAVLRELMEETGLAGMVDRHLWTIEHSDRVAHYYHVVVDPRQLTLGGPEALVQSEDNRYTPEWISLDDIDAENLQPQEIRHLLGRFRSAA
jgi:8-oxo-dGTP diphosphatase